MTDIAITENDDEDLIPVETPPAEEQAEEPKADEAQDADQDEDDDEDERLAESDDDHDEEVTANRKRRQKRREQQKRAKEAAQRELAMLRERNALMEQRLAAIEGHVTSTNAQSLEQKLALAQREVQQAEMIIARATEAGNGEDVVAAMRIRDQALANANQLAHQHQQFSQQRQQPQVDPNVAGYAKQWLDANPWYNPNGTDRDSATTKAIDAALVREGYDPRTRAYWEELTARVTDAIVGDDTPSRSKSAADTTPRRKAPPTGNTREHAPVSTKKEIYVTPERKQAMIEAGVWDDPMQRQRYLKAYQAYDKSSAR